MFGPESFMGHMLQESLSIQLWVYWLMLINTAALLFIKTREGQVVFGAWVGNIITMNVLFEIYGWVKLLGLSHLIWWTPLVVYLAMRLPMRSAGSATGAYIRILLITIIISLVFDYYDVYLYLTGKQIAA